MLVRRLQAGDKIVAPDSGSVRKSGLSFEVENCAPTVEVPSRTWSLILRYLNARRTVGDEFESPTIRQRQPTIQPTRNRDDRTPTMLALETCFLTRNTLSAKTTIALAHRPSVHL